MVAPLRNRQQQQQQQRAPPPAYDEPFADEKGPSAAAAGSRGSGRFSAVLVSSLLTALSLVTFHLLLSSSSSFPFPPSSPKPEPARPPPTHIVRGLALCQTHSSPVGPPADFAAKRERSDRFELGTKAVWIRNATIWTGANDGAEVLREGEVVLDQGIIRFGLPVNPSLPLLFSLGPSLIPSDANCLDLKHMIKAMSASRPRSTSSARLKPAATRRSTPAASGSRRAWSICTHTPG